ncbi:endonuclease [Dokdonia pacifica]|uniref:Por secretion system C-terminal sorting domain-containing protein n=1 Tax=Dokdonia pacifica TaxID=1627892 RepID=A0A239B3A6_9FLAO|nr:endonuclease [Dokdonia pacifica]SNS01718.1 Por secretion system C-terminal sorting domain-containing protein [Dokdonia pacifica]
MKKSLLMVALFCVTAIAFSQVPSYYDDVNLTLQGTSLQNELSTKVTQTHTTFLSYTPGVWQALQAADLDPTNANNVLLIYGYDDTDGNTLTDRSRDKNLNGGSAGEWNREHAYPRSLGNPNLGSTGPGSDAHHIRPSDIQLNSQRSNRKYAAGSGNAGVTAQGHFYPGDEWKGDVARMMLYMYIRYNSRCLPSNVGVGNAVASDANMIDLFLQWNVEDPVSAFEDTRNDVLAGIQGNRNPFIDNPVFATQIWGGPQAEDRFGNTTGNPGNGDAEATELFFSEYIEGSSFNKAVEIANFTGTSVALANYSLRKQTNGAGSWSSDFSLSGSLNNEAVFVVAHSSANTAILNVANTTTTNTVISFNGNDAVGLFKNGVLIDIIGTFNGGSSNFAKDVILRRKPTVLSPSTTYTTSEWDSFPSNTTSDLGSHTVEGNTPAPDTQAPTAPSNLTASNVGETSLSLSWNASSDNVAVTDYDVYNGNAVIATTANTTYTVTGLSAGTTYTFSVRAKDAASNVSSASNSITVTTDAIVLNYCNAGGNNVNFEYIDFVGIGGISNATGANGGYGDFTNQTGVIGYGSNSIVLSIGFSGQSYTENWGVWIDFNQNGTFDSSEKVVTGSTSSAGNLSYTFTVPTSAFEGTTRMRVAMKWNGVPTPCETFSYGEVEDYNVTIDSNRNAVATPVLKTDGVLKSEIAIYDVQFIQKGQGLHLQMADNRVVDYAVYTVLGQQIAQNTFRNTTTINGLRKGVYFITINDGQRTIHKKFIKK